MYKSLNAVTRTAPTKRRRNIRAAVTVSLAFTITGLTVAPAMATDSNVSGSAEYNTLKYVQGEFVKNGTGNIRFYYSNGIGVGGDDLLYLRVIANSDPSAFDTRGIRQPGFTTTLGNSAITGTRFRLQYRRAANETYNPYWAGVLKA